MKTIKITKYKGYTIMYRNSKFFAKHKNIERLFNDKEEDVVKDIEKEIHSKEAEENIAKEQKEMKKQQEKLSKTAIEFDSNEFKQSINTLDKYVREAKLYFLNNTLTIKEMDPANVAMLYHKIHYKGTLTKTTSININTIHSFLKKSAMFKSEKIRASFTIDTAKREYIVLSDGFGEVIIPTIDLDKKEEKVPELKFNTKIHITKTELNKVITLAGAVADSVKFEVKNKKFYIKAGDTLRLNKEVCNAEGNDAIAKYSIEYLKKGCVPGKELIIQFNKDYPIKIEDEKGNIFILAPRIEGD